MRIFCFGDSNTYGFDPRGYIGGRYPRSARWPDLLGEAAGVPVMADGENGRAIPCTQVELAFAARAFARLSPGDLPLVMLGTNDLLTDASAETACARMESFLRRIPCRPALIAPPLGPGEWTTPAMLTENARLAGGYRALAAQLGLPFVSACAWPLPLSFDGVHLTEAGHRALAAGLHAALADLHLL